MYRKREDPTNRISSGLATSPADFHQSPEVDIRSDLVIGLDKNSASSLPSNTKRTIEIRIYPNLDPPQSAYNLVLVNVIHHNSAWLQAHLDLLFALFEIFEARGNHSRMHHIKL